MCVIHILIFIELGLGLHVGTIKDFLNVYGVKYQIRIKLMSSNLRHIGLIRQQCLLSTVFVSKRVKQNLIVSSIQWHSTFFVQPFV